MSEPRDNEIVLEVDDETTIFPPPTYDGMGQVVEERDPVISGNCRIYFYPIEESLRSGFKPMRAGGGCPAALNQIDYIPGQRIHINIAAREGRITDALGDKKNEALLARLRRVWNQMELIGTFGQPIADAVHGLRNEDRLYTWLYWMRRLVDETTDHNRRVRVVQNGHLLPSLVDIVASGKVLLPIYEPIVKNVIKGAYLTPALAGTEVESRSFPYGQEA
jgi:hypothetical protein